VSELHEHLEHAEHAQHAAHSSFDRKVAMTIAVIAAALAGVSILGHRAHNDVLRLQGEAAVQEVNAPNGYAWYQATRVRQQALEINKQTLELQPPPASDEDRKRRDAVLKGWDAKIAEYKGDLTERRSVADNAKQQAKELTAQAHFVHRQADRLDVGDLAVQLGLVLASIAVLTKRRAFWIAGIAACLVGLAVTGSAYQMTPHPDEHSPGDSHSPAKDQKDAKPSSGH
jgi:Domain of unknown function (DUF4337)